MRIRPGNKKKPLDRSALYLGLTLALSLVLLFAGFSFKSHVVKRFKSEQAALDENTTFFDLDGKAFHVIRGEENRRYISLAEVSRNLQMAVVAIEDARFFKHPGIDPIRIVGAMLRLLKPNATIHGASTITQQLVKLTLLSPERSLRRKITEIFMAMALEWEFSKPEILEFYLNKLYLGQRTYGVEKASLSYFHKSAGELNLAESAFIAGLIKKPEGYSPFVNLKAARKRQVLVLHRLRALDWISKDAYKNAMEQSILVRQSTQSDLKRAPYFTSHVLQELKKTFPHHQIFGGGLKVFTTLSSEQQNKMEQAINQRFAKPRQFDQMAGLSLDPVTGYVHALVGGVDFNQSEFNRATQAKRQPGSSFKPIVYATALDKGIKAQDIFMDEPLEYTRITDEGVESYQPENFTGEHKGPITVHHALVTSNNVVSVRILKEIGINTLTRMARKFGLELPSRRGLCLALGCGEVSLLKLVSAYAVFANGGHHTEAVFILKVEDAKGNLLYEHEPNQPEKILSDGVLFQINRMLQDVVAKGTGRAASIGVPQAGKTGTSDDFRDAWFIGFTPKVVAGFWVGNDDNSSTGGEVGGRTPARLWRDYLKALPSLIDEQGFEQYPEFEQFRLCDNSGKLATQFCPSSSWIPLKKGEPSPDYCDLHGADGLQDVLDHQGQPFEPDFSPEPKTNRWSWPDTEEPPATAPP